MTNTHPTDTSEELREAARRVAVDAAPYPISNKDALIIADAALAIVMPELSRARSTTGLMEVDVRGIALVAMVEQRKSGESDEMCARWISERVHKAASQSPTPREKP